MSSEPPDGNVSQAAAGLVLGTAGHIDHGKTALVRALTGIDCDRLPEEKQRGITIDLGFAPLDLDGDLRLSIVDVPGHERLVRTMVSGASGIDLLLLVVAADEGVMPQTREHVAICELLGIERAVVALTKIDLTDDEMLVLATEDVRELLAGTVLAEAAIVPVSATRGDGVEMLRGELGKLVATAPPRTARGGAPRLAIDRAFTKKGFGAVVTGTLVGAELSVGDAVEVQPGGQRARVRGLQSHGNAAKRVAPGVRCAVNLQGLELADLSRGQVVTLPGSIEPTTSFDARITWLPHAAIAAEEVSIELLAGTARRRARAAPIGAAPFASGGSGFARVHVDGPAIALAPGDRFIAHGFARSAQAGLTVGGGVVLDIAPPHRRRSDLAIGRELSIFETGEAGEILCARIERTGLAGAARDVLLRESGLSPELFDAALRVLCDDGDVIAASDGAHFAAHAVAERLRGELLAALDAFHSAEPLLPGMQLGTLRAAAPHNTHADVTNLVLAALRASGEISIEGELVRRPDHSPSLDADTQRAVDAMRREAAAAGLEPPNPRDWAQSLGIGLERFRDLAAHLERERALVRAPGDLWFASQAIDALRERVIAHLQEHGQIDTAAYKRLTGTSRRTTVPLMELLDELHVTRRQGDVRVLRKG